MSSAINLLWFTDIVDHAKHFSMIDFRTNNGYLWKRPRDSNRRWVPLNQQNWYLLRDWGLFIYFWPSVVCYLTKWDLINQISLNSRNYKLKFGIRLTLKHLAKIKYSLKNHQLKLKLDKLLVNIIVLRWPKTSKWFLSKRNDLIKWR